MTKFFCRCSLKCLVPTTDNNTDIIDAYTTGPDQYIGDFDEFVSIETPNTNTNDSVTVNHTNLNGSVPVRHTLRTLIFADINFCGFREFYPCS